MALFQIPVLPEAMLRARGYQALEQSLLRSSRRGTFSSQELAAYREAWAQPGALTAMINWYRALRYRPPPAADLRVPTRLIWGERDRFLLKEMAAETALRFPLVDLVSLPDASHWLHLEEPERIGELMVEHFRSYTGTAHAQYQT